MSCPDCEISTQHSGVRASQVITPPGRKVRVRLPPMSRLNETSESLGLEQKLLRRLQWSLRACSEWVKVRRALPRGCIGRDYMASSLHAENRKLFLFSTQHARIHLQLTQICRDRRVMLAQHKKLAADWSCPRLLDTAVEVTHSQMHKHALSDDHLTQSCCGLQHLL